MSAEAATAARQLSLRKTWPVDTAETVVRRLAAMALSQPGRPAVVHREAEWTYSALADRVAGIRALLVDAGCKAGVVVACAGARSADTVAVFLALESLGAVYLPLDTSWPAQRMAIILRGSQASLLLTYGQDGPATAGTAMNAARQTGVMLVEVGSMTAWDGEDLADTLAAAGRLRCTDDAEPRYLFYTSGTTGVPKGALVEHRGMINHLWSKVTDLRLTTDDRIAFTAPLVFDIAVCQMLLPIMLGGCVVVLDDNHTRFPRSVVSEMRRQDVTVIEAVPTVVGWITDVMGRTGAAPLPALRLLMSTGEELRPPLARRVAEVLPQVALFNVYGFTETSDDVTHHEVAAADLQELRLPVGEPIINSALYVLVEGEAGWRPAAEGEPGELFVGGLPVGLGYPDNPQATRRAFLRDCIDPASVTGRLYRSGDAAMIQGGLLYCLGRLDRQTKIAGVRIEPDEIEALLLQHPAVSSCAVVVDDGGRERELVAFFVPATAAASPESMKEHLTGLLPTAMVPNRWMAVTTLPLTVNGKVDHSALLALV